MERRTEIGSAPVAAFPLPGIEEKEKAKINVSLSSYKARPCEYKYAEEGKKKKEEEEEEDSPIHILLGSECISLSAASSNPRFRISNLLILLFASSQTDLDFAYVLTAY